MTFVKIKIHMKLTNVTVKIFNLGLSKSNTDALRKLSKEMLGDHEYLFFKFEILNSEIIREIVTAHCMTYWVLDEGNNIVEIPGDWYYNGKGNYNVC
jgi:hypothetical protein